MKAILRYMNYVEDGKIIFSVLSEHNVEILRTKHDASIYPKVTIRIKDNGELMELLHDLNYKCFHEVSVVKIKTEAGIIERIKRIFE